MADFLFQGYFGAGPTWTTLQNVGQLVGFYGNGYGDRIAVDSYQSSTHISGAGGDACTTNHNRNVKYISSNQFDSGSGTESLTDANLATTECTLRVYLSGGTTSVAVQNGRLFCYNGTTVTTFATGIQVYAFERGESDTAWTSINDGSANGGDNVSKRLDLADKTAATDHYWYVAISCSPKSVGEKTAFAFGSTLEYY